MAELSAAAAAAWRKALAAELPDVEDEDDLVAPSAVRFLSLEELHASTPDEPEWVWEDYIPAGAAVLIAGKPKVGKSSLVFGLVRAICNGVPDFLGHPVAKAPIVYVSEEGASSLKDKLPPHGEMSILTREGAYPQPQWAQLVEEAVDEAAALGAKLIVIDTLRKWAKFASELEKDASSMQAVVSAVDAATRQGIAVLLVHHQRKAEGEHGDAVAGSNALPGAVDVVLEVQRTDAGHRQRVLLAESRWRTPHALIFERHEDDHDYDVIAEGEDRREAMRDVLIDEVVAYVLAAGGATTTMVKSGVQGGSDAITSALAKAVAQQRLSVEKVGNANRYAAPLPPDPTLPSV